MSDVIITTFVGLTPEQQILKNANDIKELQNKSSEGVTTDQMNQAIDSAIEPINNDLTRIIRTVENLSQSHKSEFHTIETITKTINPEDWSDNKVTFTNENFSLLDSIISWSPEGTIENIKNCANAYVVLNEQTVDGSITFECETTPTEAIYIIIKVELKGEAY